MNMPDDASERILHTAQKDCKSTVEIFHCKIAILCIMYYSCVVCSFIN